MKNVTSTNPLILIRQYTQSSDIPSQRSQSVNLPTQRQIRDQQIKNLLGKTLKYLNKNDDFLSFKKRILVPKRKQNEFLEMMQFKRRKQSANRLLIGGSKSLKGKPKNIPRKSYNEHDIYSDPYNEVKQKFKSVQTKQKYHGKKSYDMHSISLSKIQLLASKEKQETMAEEKYENQNYIFLNMKKMGQSMQLQSCDIQLQKNYSKALKIMPGSRKISEQGLSTNFNRVKVKSVTKYDRDRQNHKMQQTGYPQRNINQHKGKGHLQTRQNMRPGKNTQSPQQNNMIRLMSIQSSKNAQKNRNSPILAGIKSLLNINNFNIPKPFQITCFAAGEDQKFNFQLGQISQKFNESIKTQNCLHLLLAGISKDSNKDTIRIYKDDFQKVYTYRYGRDKITSFFDYEYIEDYGSLYELFTQNVLSFKKQEVLLASFLMLDFDNDGLISHSDLFKMLTFMDKNSLVKKNIYTILKYVRQKGQRNPIKDVCSEDYTKKENLTLKKYKFLIYMRQKKKTEFQTSIMSSSKLNSRQVSPIKQLSRQDDQKFKTLPSRAGPLHRCLFNLRQPPNQTSKGLSILKVFLESIAKNNETLFSGMCSFSINFERFKSIYTSHVPQIYYDMIYSAFGYKDPSFQYEDLDYETPLIKTRKITLLQDVSKYDILLQNLNQMRQTRQDLTTKLFRPDLKRHKRIKSMLD